MKAKGYDRARAWYIVGCRIGALGDVDLGRWVSKRAADVLDRVHYPMSDPMRRACDVVRAGGRVRGALPRGAWYGGVRSHYARLLWQMRAGRGLRIRVPLKMGIGRQRAPEVSRARAADLDLLQLRALAALLGALDTPAAPAADLGVGKRRGGPIGFSGPSASKLIN